MPLPLPYEQGDTFDPARVAWVNTEQDIQALIASLMASDETAWDIETTGLNSHATRERDGWAARVAMLTATTVDLAAGEVTNWVLPLSHPEGPWRASWRSILDRVAHVLLRLRGKPLAAHNGKFDIRYTAATIGVNLAPALTWDTQVIGHLLNENRSTRLKAMAQEHFGIEDWADVDLDVPGAAESVPLLDLGLYAARDTYWTWRLYRLQQAETFRDEDEGWQPLGPEESEAAWLGQFAEVVTMPTVRQLSQMEQAGMRLDLDWVGEEKDRMVTQRDETAATLVGRFDPDGPLPDTLDDGERRALAGSRPSFAPTSKWFTGWAKVAVADDVLRVDAVTPGGKPQWSRHVLTRQAREGSDVAQTLLDHRHAVKRLEFLDSWSEVVSDAGTVHASYNVGRVMTGRLSSSEPNMQQVTKTLKPAYVPRDGFLLAEIDYSQIELRAAAFVARCAPMIEAYQRGDDLHRLMARTILQYREDQQAGMEDRPARLITVEDVTAKERQEAKAANFGLLYLQSPMGFQTYAETVYGVHLTLAEAEVIHSLFFEQWTGMREWQHRMVDRAHRDGQVVSPLGRVRRLPDIDSGSEFKQGQAERQAVNSTVQSFASDLMQISAADIAGLYDAPAVPDIRLVGTVHDSLVAEVPADDWQRACARIMHRMLNPHRILERMGCHLDVPLAAEATVGTRWGLGDVGLIA